MKSLNENTAVKKAHPVKVLQYGEGNFLRAFFDWMLEEANSQGVTDASVVIVSPRFKANDTIKALQRQDGLYHVCLEGIEKGEPKQSVRLVTSVAEAFSPAKDTALYLKYVTSPDLRFVVSNTTEAGIRYEPEGSSVSLDAATFPGKIAAMLYVRFRHFDGDPSKGLIFLCCELIENNGQLLREYVLRHAEEWGLGDEFRHWVENSCFFCDTLVDRIVSGYPHDSADSIKEALGYDDRLLVKGELYHVWAIGGEGASKVKAELPLHKAGLNVLYLPSVNEFREKKVRILNGSHTGMVPVALQLGCETVLDAFSNRQVNKFINDMMAKEVLPMIEGDPEELRQFADGILERFYNPYIRHMLKSIALNSLSKWETRNFPTVKDMWQKEGKLADYELFTFAALLTLYAPDSGFTPQDNALHLQIIRDNWDAEDIQASVVGIVNGGIFTENFEEIVPGFSAKVGEYVKMIKDYGMEGALGQFLSTH